MSTDATVITNSTDNMDVRILATEFLMYKVGKSVLLSKNLKIYIVKIVYIIWIDFINFKIY